MKRERFIELLETIPSKRVLVAGDFILDEYLIGDTKRVSREAPVIVIDYKESAFHPGGAANAAQNVTAVGAAAEAFGVVGADRYGEVLREILRTRGAGVEGLVETGEIATAVKTRILAGDLHAQKQQVARIDRSYRIARSSPVIEEVRRRALERIGEADAVLISDYAMGVSPGPLSEALIDAAARRRIPVVVDSRFDLPSYRGATVATPNEVELFDAMNVKKRDGADLVALARRAIEEAGLAGIIVTRGSRGMLVCDSLGRVDRIGIVGTPDVTDVTGAGDSVAAIAGLSLAAGAALAEAAEMATYAASVVVMKRGTATMTVEELVAARDKQPVPYDAGER
jgi:rfaE bifunctional protein kinase chain/domain